MASIQRLGDFLGEHDLPVAELAAARLDGHLAILGRSFTPVDVPDGVASRARSLRGALRPRLIADRRTAAWVHGALPVLPHSLDACVRIDARVSALLDFDGSIRQVVIDESELADFGGVLVTTPLRTIFDLVREVEFDAARCALVRELGRVCAIGLETCLNYLEGRAHLPNKALTRARLTDAFERRDAA